jgi:predicted HicB family RNase H-like nuclease
MSKSKALQDKSVFAKAKKALKQACQAAESDDWVTLHNAVFGIDGVVHELFKTASERTAFSETAEFKEIWRMIEELQGADDGYLQKLSSANGNVSIRMPRSLHAALLREADAEGVSLNQLCVGKLALQLRSAVAD